MILNLRKEHQPNRRQILRVFEKDTLKILDKLDEYSESDLSNIPDDVLSGFQEYIEDLGFTLNLDVNGIKEFKLTGENLFLSKSWSLRAHITKKEIWFSAPLTKSLNGSLIVETFQTACEFIAYRPLIVFDTDNYEWLDYNSDPIVVRSYNRHTKKREV